MRAEDKNFNESRQISSESLFHFISDITSRTVSNLISGSTDTASDIADGANCLVKGNYRDAADIAARRAGRIAHGAVELVRNGAAITAACCDTLLSDAPTTSRNKTDIND